MDASSNRASKYKNQKLKEVKGEIDESTIIAGDFNTPLAITDRPTRHKIRRTQQYNQSIGFITNLQF